MSSISSAVVIIAQARRMPPLDAITMVSSRITRPTNRPSIDKITRQVVVIISAFIVLVLVFAIN
jgi:hypothetical protein